MLKTHALSGTPTDLVIAVFVVASAMSSVVYSAETVKVHVFRGSNNLALMVADEKGFFDKNNIKLELSFTQSSTEQLTGVRDGKWDLGTTATDNVIAYNINEGADFFMFMGVGGTTLRLFVSPGVKSFSDLKGKSLAVDAVTTGYAFVLQKILHENGLKPSDYKLVPVGGTVTRFESLKKEETMGTLLTPPYISQAREAGLKDMGEVTRYIPGYANTIGFTTRRWAEAHRDTLVRFIRAYITAVDWIFDPKNRTEAASILARNIKLSQEAAAGSIDEDLMHPTMGLYKKATIPVDGIRTVIALRAEMGHLKPPLPDPPGFYDLSYLEKASR